MKCYLSILAVTTFFAAAPCFGGETGHPFLELGKVWNYKYTYNDGFPEYHEAVGTETFWIEKDSTIDNRRVFLMCHKDAERDDTWSSW